MNISDINALEIEDINISMHYNRHDAEVMPDRAFTWSLTGRSQEDSDNKSLHTGPNFDVASSKALFCAAACLENLYLLLRTELKKRNADLNLTMIHRFSDGTEAPSLWQVENETSPVSPSQRSLSKFDALC